MKVSTGSPQLGRACERTKVLALNAERARAEACSGQAVANKQGKKASAKRAPKESDTGDLFS